MPTREATIAPTSVPGEMSIRHGGVSRHAIGLAGGAAGVADSGPILPLARQLRIYMRLERLLKH